MTREKIKQTWIRNIHYSEEHWELLRRKREKASKILATLSEKNIQGYVYGSIARGDCSEKSDIDIILFSPPTPFILERILDKKFNIYAKEISQATPKLAVKGHFYLDQKTTISFPITKLSQFEREFYTYAGKIALPVIKQFKERVPGIDKRLVLIIPTKEGHEERSIIGREKTASKVVGVPMELILKRERLLKRRDKKGRSGPFIREKLGKNESFDSILRRLAARNPFLREQLRKNS